MTYALIGGARRCGRDGMDGARVSGSTYERMTANLDSIERSIARARRLIRVQWFLIGALVSALVLAYAR